jgi:hypothetical protein
VIAAATKAPRSERLHAVDANVAYWHIAAFAATHHFVAYWSNNGQLRTSALICYAANDP